ncbi:unnamed protein product, partial [Mesorhabditis belari]|uniref:Aquaporin n=1 Tax=Mesorhabditis belari TaxID=2138241 RepID=A0AAF3J1M3_9BILA
MKLIPLWRRLIAEVYSTGFMVFIGIAATEQRFFSNGMASSTTDLGLAWGFAITFAIYSAYNVSGGHINPSISVARWWLGKLSAIDFVLYFLAQTVGAVLGTILALFVYREAFQDKRSTGDFDLKTLFVSLPAPHTTHFGGFIDQIIGTSFLGMFVCMTSRRNSPIPDSAVPLLFGLNAVMLGNALGLNTGCPLNPARELGPRIAATLLGLGNDFFSHDEYYVWVLVVGPLVGSVLGVLLYQIAVIDTTAPLKECSVCGFRKGKNISGFYSGIEKGSQDWSHIIMTARAEEHHFIFSHFTINDHIEMWIGSVVILISSVFLISIAEHSPDSEMFSRFLEKRGGARVFMPVDKRGGGRGFNLETRGGARAFIGEEKRGGGRVFLDRNMRGGARVFQFGDHDDAHSVDPRGGARSFYEPVEMMRLGSMEKRGGARAFPGRTRRGGARSFPVQLPDSSERK